MTTTPQTTPLDREQVEAQIREWMNSGLPSGSVMFSSTRRPWVFLEVDDANAVVVWAMALGQRLRLVDGEVVTSECYPVALPGWSLEVYCSRSDAAPAQRIEVAS